MLNIINATNGGIVTVVSEGKDMERCDVGVKGGDTMEKYNNKEREKPFINYNN